MSSFIKIKRSEVSGNPAVLGAGELAYSGLTDNGSNGGDRLYIGMGTETAGNAVNHVVIGGKYFTDQITAATSANTANTLVKRDSNGAAYLSITGNVTGDVTGNLTGTQVSVTDVTISSLAEGRLVFSDADGKLIDDSRLRWSNNFGQLETYQLIVNNETEFRGNVRVTQLTTGRVTFADANQRLTDNANLTFDATTGALSATTFIGDVTGNANTATAWLNPRSLELTGDATATFTGVDGSANKSTTLTFATVNSNVGQFGSATAIPIVTVNAKGLVTAITTASIATALSISGGTGSDTVSLLVDTLVFEGNTGVATTVTDNKVSFAIGQPVATTDNVVFNDVTANGTLYSNDITAANVSITGNAIITGNLTVEGTTTTVNSTTIAVGDKNISLAKDANTAAEADGGGLTVVGPTIAATLIYSAVDDRWNFNKNLNVATVYGNVVGNATSADKWSSARNLSLTGDATATLSSIDGTSDVTTAITLATVNTTVGGYGTSTTVPTITVNAKGLVTAVTTTAIPTATYSTNGLASFDTTQFTVTSGAVSVSMVDGGTY